MAIDWCFCEAVGGVYTWGRNLFGRSGIGGVQDGFVPTYVSVGTNLDDGDGSRSSHSSGREGNFHSLHVRDRDRVNRPPKVVQVAAGANHNLALTADGVVWSWGYNACIQLKILHYASSFLLLFIHELRMFECYLMCSNCMFLN